MSNGEIFPVDELRLFNIPEFQVADFNLHEGIVIRHIQDLGHLFLRDYREKFRINAVHRLVDLLCFNGVDEICQ